MIYSIFVLRIDDSRGGVPMPDGLTLHPDTLWSLTCRRPWVIGVLDGHGSGGRLASHEASKVKQY